MDFISSAPVGQKITQFSHKVHSLFLIFSPEEKSSKAPQEQTATHPPHSPQRSGFNSSTIDPPNDKSLKAERKTQTSSWINRASCSHCPLKKCWSNLTPALRNIKVFLKFCCGDQTQIIHFLRKRLGNAQ